MDASGQNRSGKERQRSGVQQVDVVCLGNRSTNTFNAAYRSVRWLLIGGFLQWLWCTALQQCVGFVKKNALIHSIPATPPWLLKRPHINYNIHYFYKDTSPEIYRNKFFEFCDHYKDFSELHTDGSKMGNEVAASVVHGNVTITTRLPNKASIFRAELHAISLAL